MIACRMALSRALGLLHPSRHDQSKNHPEKKASNASGVIQILKTKARDKEMSHVRSRDAVSSSNLSNFKAMRIELSRGGCSNKQTNWTSDIAQSVVAIGLYRTKTKERRSHISRWF
jgi:hypothetical protein